MEHPQLSPHCHHLLVSLLLFLTPSESKPHPPNDGDAPGNHGPFQTDASGRNSSDTWCRLQEQAEEERENEQHRYTNTSVIIIIIYTSFFLHPGTLHLLEICIAKQNISLSITHNYLCQRLCSYVHYNSSYIVRFVTLALILYVHVYLGEKKEHVCTYRSRTLGHNN